MRLLPVILIGTIALSAGCGNSKTETVHRDTDVNEVPTMTTYDVVTLISDSGVTRYRITAPLWLVYDEAAEPKWRFPEGMLMEKFDSVYETEATVKCDSATYFKNLSLWRLDGNVNILNTAGEKFLTPQLYWDQNRHKIYSDSFIHIERVDRTIEGYGFESNDRMTAYTILNPTGIFPASEFRRHHEEPDSTVIPE